MCVNLSCFSLNVRGFVIWLNARLYFYFVHHRKEMFIFFKKHIAALRMKPFGAINGEVMFYFVMVLITLLEFWFYLIIRNFGGSILHSIFSSEGRWIIVVVIMGDSLFILINVYGYNNHSQNRIVFEDLSYKILDLKDKYPSATVIVGGDFNEAPDLCLDRFPPKPESYRCNTIISLIIFVVSFL